MRRTNLYIISLLSFAALCFAGTDGNISGTVFYNNSGTLVALAGANVTLDPTPPEAPNITALTNGDGNYSFGNLTYSDAGILFIISARFQNNASQSVLLNLSNAAPSIEQNLALNPVPPGESNNGTNGSIYGYVRFGGNLTAANITLRNQSATIAVNITEDGVGYYSFSGLYYPDTYSILAMPLANPGINASIDNMQLNSGNYIVAQNISINPGGDQGGQCNGNYSISGYLLNPEGQLILDQLGVNAYGGMMGGSSNQSVNGSYTLSCLTNGTWYVGAGGFGYQWEQVNVTITNASNSSINITLYQMQGGPQGCGGSASIYGYVRGNASGVLVNLSTANVFAGTAQGGQGGEGGMGGGQGGGEFCGGGTQTDNTGFYNISGLRAGTFMLNVMPAQDSGYGEVHLGPDDWITLQTNTSQREKNFTLLQSGFVYGCVLGNNTTALVPLQGASVNIFEPTPSGAWGWGQSGENGCFNVSISPGTGYMININSPYNSGYSNYMQGPQDGGTGINVTSGATTVFGNVTLRLGARIRGYVKNSNGTGLQWVSVNAHPRMMGGPGMGGGNDWGFANTNEQGYFEISGLTENNTYELEAFPDPNSDYSSGRAQAELTGAITEMNITLTTGNRVFGIVTCEGSPVAYVPVNVFSSEGRGNGPMMGQMESGRFAFSMSDNSGQYSARGLLAGNYSMRVETPWNQQINCSGVFESVEVGGTVEHNVSMPLSSSLTGYVLAASDNSTIPYGFVDAFIPSQGGPGEEMMGPSAYAMVDANGAYTLHLTPSNSSYIVHVQPPWGTTYAGQERTVRINTSGQTTVLNFSLTSGGIISGTVVNSSGSAVQFAFVNAFSETAHSFGFASTSTDGTFSVRGLSAARDFNLFIQPSFTSSTYATVVPTFVEDVTVTEGQTTDLGTINASSADSSLALTITDNASGLANLNVHAWKPFTPFFGYCSTNASGMCDINGLLSGSYDVFIEPSGERPPVFRSVNVSGSSSYAFDYTSDLGSLYDINGTVSNGTNAIPYADVGIFSESAHFGTHALADSNGFFTLYGVPVGNYTLNADSWGYYHYMEQLEVGANAVHNITMTSFNVAESFTVDGYLVSPTSSSVSTKTVVIVDAQNASLFSTFNVTNANGYYTIAGVPASTYIITAAMGNQTYSSNQTAVSANTSINITVS